MLWPLASNVRIAAIFCLALFCLGAVASLQAQQLAVTTVEAHQELRTRPIHASGTLASKLEARLSFKTSGLVAQLHVDEGEVVTAGDMLAELDPAEVDASLEQAEARFAKAGRDLERFEQIYAQRVIPLEQLQNARTELDLATAALDIAHFNKRHSIIRANASGRVLKRLAEVGELVVTGEPIYLMSSDQGGWVVRVWLADRDIVRLRLGDRADVSLDALPGSVLSGEVSEIAAAANGQAGLFEVEVALLDTPTELRSGFIAKVVLTPQSEKPLYYLPMASVVSVRGGEADIYVYDPLSQRVSRRPVPISHLLDSEIAVSGGIGESEQIVSKGAAYLREGMRVLLITESAAGEV